MSQASPSPEEIFHQARQIKGSVERDWYLKGACDKDLALRSKVDALLTADADAGAFLSSGNNDLSGASAQEPLGSMIGRYKLLQEIGEGGFGVVYMAEQKEPVKRRVALKVIKLGMDTRQVIARFEAERQALAMMEHAHIAKVLDAGATDSGRPYFVMELVKGISITDYCDQNNLTIEERLKLFALVCSAIQHAHQKGIVHRDIKPSNVLVTLHDGVPVPKVIDFGIAKATGAELTAKTLFTEHGQMIGTPLYMSPEQAEMSGLDIDTRSDIYSLGVLLYELLTGTTPFTLEELREAGFGELQRLIREQEPQKPSTRLSTLESLPSIAAHRRIEPRKLGPLILGDLDWIIMKALEKDRTRRYETATAFADDIARHLAGDAVVAAPPSKLYLLRKFVRRNRGLVLATSLVSAALLVGILGLSMGLWRAERANRDTETALAAELEAKDRAEWSAYTANLLLAQSAMEAGNWPEARRRTAECPAEKRGWEWEFLSNKAESVIAQFPGEASLSPDGRTVLTVLGGLVVFAGLEGKRVGDPLLDLGEMQLIRTAWTANGEYVLVETRAPDVVRRYDRSGKLVGQPIDCHIDHPAHLTTVSSEGHWIVTGDRDRTLYLWDSDGRATGIEYRHESGVERALFTPDDTKLVTLSQGIVWTWDREGTLIGKTRQQPSNPWDDSIAVSPDSRSVLAAIGDTAHLWDLFGNPLGAPMRQLGNISQAEFSPDGTLIMTRGRYGIQLWNLDGTPKGSFINDSNTQAAGFTEDGEALLTASNVYWTNSATSDHSMRIWSLEGEPVGADLSWPIEIESLVHNQRAQTILVFAPSDFDFRGKKYLAPLPLRTAERELGSNAHTMLNAAAELGVDVGSLERVAARPSQAALRLDPSATASTVLPDGSRIATASGRSIRVWDPVTRRELTAIRMVSNVRNLMFTPDGTRLVIQLSFDFWQVFDTRSAEDQATEVQRRWSEREPAGEYVDALMDGSTPNSSLLSSIVAAQSLSPLRRLVAAELLAERLADIQHEAGRAFDEITRNQTDKALVLAAARAAKLSTRAREQLLSLITAWEYKQPKLSLAAEAAANKKRAERLSYSVSLQAAQAQLEDGNIADAQRLHALCPEPYRGWEWNHLGLSLVQSLQTLEEHTDSVSTVTWSPDGARIVSGSDDKTLRIWNATNGESQLVLEGHQESVNAVAWSPDGKRIASGALDNTIRIWDANNGESLLTIKEVQETVNSLAWNPDGTRIASGLWDGNLRIWDATSGESLLILEGHQVPVLSVAWSPDGERIVSGAMDYTLRIWDANSGKRLRIIDGLAYDALCVAWSPDGKDVVSGHKDYSLHIWDAASGESLHILEGHSGMVTSVGWSPDGTRIVSGSTDKTLRVWDADNGRLLSTLKGSRGRVNSVAWSPDGMRIVSGADDATLQIWEVAGGGSASPLERSGEGLSAVAWSLDGTRIAVGADDGTLQILDATNGESLLLVLAHEREITESLSIAWSPDGKRIVSGSRDKTLRIWDAVNGNKLLVLEGHDGWVKSVAWSPDGKHIASGSADATLRIWDAITGEILQVIEGYGGNAWENSVAWSPDGTRIVAGAGDDTLRIWDTASGKSLLTLEGHKGWVFSVAWNPGGTRIVSGSEDKTLRIWDAVSGKDLLLLEGHEGEVRSVAWSPDGRRIVSGAVDTTLQIWDANSGDRLQILGEHEGEVSSVAWSPDGRRIVSAAWWGDKPLLIWESNLQDALPVWRANDKRQRVRALVSARFKEHILLKSVLSALRDDLSIPEDLRNAALRSANSRGNPTLADLNGRAWDLVDPERKDEHSDVDLGLRLARAGIELAPEGDAIRNTLAWALFANGLYDEALAESKRTLGLATEESKAKCLLNLERLRKNVARLRGTNTQNEEPSTLK